MNIEVANKLVKLRKQAGLSQEELADKLGLSRQAVSKWERAEASPDTDNLICLAKLYNVSLDELLSTEDDVETIVKEQVAKGEEIDDDELRNLDDERREKEQQVKKRNREIYVAIESILCACVLIVYLILGFTIHTWGTLWCLIFIPGVITSFIRCIREKTPIHFNITFLSLFTFFLVCLVLLPEKNLWHPMWVVFLAIPAYYSVSTSIMALFRKKEEEEEEKE